MHLNTITRALAASALSLFVMTGTAFAHGYKLGDLEIQHPNARAMLPGQKVGGGFMTIINNGKTDDKLVSVTSPVSDDVQIHEMSVTDGIMKMRQLKDGVPLPAGKTVTLKNGALHVMFMNVKTPFKEGDKVPGTLHFEKAGDVAVEFMTGPANGKGPSEGKGSEDKGSEDKGHDMKGMKM